MEEPVEIKLEKFEVIFKSMERSLISVNIKLGSIYNLLEERYEDLERERRIEDLQKVEPKVSPTTTNDGTPDSLSDDPTLKKEGSSFLTNILQGVGIFIGEMLAGAKGIAIAGAAGLVASFIAKPVGDFLSGFVEEALNKAKGQIGIPDGTGEGAAGALGKAIGSGVEWGIYGRIAAIAFGKRFGFAVAAGGWAQDMMNEFFPNLMEKVNEALGGEAAGRTIFGGVAGIATLFVPKIAKKLLQKLSEKIFAGGVWSTLKAGAGATLRGAKAVAPALAQAAKNTVPAAKAGAGWLSRLAPQVAKTGPLLPLTAFAGITSMLYKAGKNQDAAWEKASLLAKSGDYEGAAQAAKELGGKGEWMYPEFWSSPQGQKEIERRDKNKSDSEANWNRIRNRFNGLESIFQNYDEKPADILPLPKETPKFDNGGINDYLKQIQPEPEPRSERFIRGTEDHVSREEKQKRTVANLIPTVLQGGANIRQGDTVTVNNTTVNPPADLYLDSQQLF